MSTRLRAVLLTVLAASAAGTLALLTASGAGGARSASASATAFERASGGNERGLVRVRGNGSRTSPSGRARASASTSGRRGSARASASVGRVRLFDGLVTARAVSVTATARGGAASTGGRVTGLRIDNRAYGTRTQSASLTRGGVTVTVLRRRGGGITGLRARLNEAHKGNPAGATATVAYAAARARNGTAPAARSRDAGERRRPATPNRAERPGRRKAAAARRKRAPKLDADLTGRRYVFPVYGKSSFTNDWGAPRADTGTHEGTDVFAPTGTPVLAVTDGTLSRVGTRPVPGNRLWLENDRGDTFFYGHMSAFASDARNGAKVRAGDVVGFVGSTGGAERTPPHLHFEVHPGDGDAVNPYPFLRAWQERRDVPRAAWLERYGADAGSRPGALVVVEDYLER